MSESDDRFWDFDPPDRIEPRGDFPRHSGFVGMVLSGEQAAELAARRLREWELNHGH